MSGPVLVEIGATWCGFCQAAKPVLQKALRDFPDVHRIWIEDGKGRPVGRSFGVKLWPTLVFMRDGKVIRQTSRPDAEQIRAGLESITGAVES
jgi:thioredoxin 1